MIGRLFLVIGVALTFLLLDGCEGKWLYTFCARHFEAVSKWNCESKNLIDYLLAELNYKRFMFKKLCILLIFSKLKVNKLLIDKYRMHNLYAIFAKLLNICKQIAGNLVNESGNVPRRGVVPKFSDLEVVALNMASEAAPY